MKFGIWSKNVYKMNSQGISLGWNCSSASWGVDTGIRGTRANGYLTCPFDEMLTNYAGIVECIRNDFEGFTDPANLMLKHIPSDAPYCAGDSLVYNQKYKFLFNHESPGHANLYIDQNWAGGKDHYIRDNWKEFRERYDRRIENFRSYMKSGVFITFILTYPFEPTELYEAIRQRYPSTKFTIKRLDVRDMDHYREHMKLMETNI